MFFKRNLQVAKRESSKRRACFLAVLMLTVGILGWDMTLPETAEAGIPNFIDVGITHWAYGSVRPICEKGIVKGYADGTFKPNRRVTYGEFIKMVTIAVNGQDVGIADVKAGATNWASGYYKAAVASGLFDETQISENRLNQEIPRSDMALIAANAIGAGKVEDYDELAKSITDIFGEENEYEIMQSFAAGVITGYPDGTFLPKGTLSRAESAVVIHRIIDESERVLPELLRNREIAENQSKPAKEVAGQPYVIDSLDKYVTNYRDKRYAYLTNHEGSTYMDSKINWTQDIEVYPKGVLEIEINPERTWEEVEKLHKKLPTLYPKLFHNFDVENELSYVVYLIKDKKIIEQPKIFANFDKVNSCNITSYTYPTKFDYIAFASSTGVDVRVRIYPNPFI